MGLGTWGNKEGTEGHLVKGGPGSIKKYPNRGDLWSPPVSKRRSGNFLSLIEEFWEN